MTLDIFKEKGMPLDKQVFTWVGARSWNTFCWSTGRSLRSVVIQRYRVRVQTWQVLRRSVFCKC